MKKTLLLLAFVASLAGHADYLYWMVDNPATGKDIQGNDTTFDWTTAILKAEADETIMSLSSSDAATYAALDSYAVADIGSSYSGKSFFIELYNGDTWLAKTASSSASSLSSYIFSSNSMAAVPAAGFGQAGTTSYNVPEPTSGLLFLVGGMLLGLKRRRQV